MDELWFQKTQDEIHLPYTQTPISRHLCLNYSLRLLLKVKEEK